MLDFIVKAPIPWRKRFWMLIGLCALKARSLIGGARAKEPDRIVCVLFTRAGDIISAIPFLSVMRRRYPQAPITLVVYKEVREVAEGIEEVERVVAVDRRSLMASARQIVAVRGDARTLVLAHSINPLVALLFLVSPARTVGGYLWQWTFSRQAGGGFRMRKLAVPFDHLVRQHTVIAEELGIPLDPLPEVHWSIREQRLGEETRELLAGIEKGRGEGVRTIVVVPGSRSANRVWPIENFARLVAQLITLDRTRILLAGAPAERETAEALVGISRTRIENLAGRSNFTEFAAVISKADLVICNDSAASHLSAVFRTPCVAFFGPVDPELRDHHRRGHRFVPIRGTEACRCGYDFFDESACPHGVPCIRSIEPDRVFSACRQLLAGDASY